MIADLSKHTGLIKALTERYLFQRYRGSFLGFFWSVLNPLCLMLVYLLVFQYYTRFSTIPNYAIFLFCGLLPWIWTQSSLIEGSNSIIAGGHLITKSMFPAEVLPIVAVLTNFVNFLLALPILFAFMFFGGVLFKAGLLALPFVILIHLIFNMGLALCLAALNVYYRDVQHIVANILNLVFFLCPIIYTIDLVPKRLRFTLEYNPFAAFVRSYQEVILYGEFPSTFLIVFMIVSAVVALFLGLYTFAAFREKFAESL